MAVAIYVCIYRATQLTHDSTVQRVNHATLCRSLYVWNERVNSDSVDASRDRSMNLSIRRSMDRSRDVGSDLASDSSARRTVIVTNGHAPSLWLSRSHGRAVSRPNTPSRAPSTERSGVNVLDSTTVRLCALRRADRPYDHWSDAVQRTSVGGVRPLEGAVALWTVWPSTIASGAWLRRKNGSLGQSPAGRAWGKYRACASRPPREATPVIVMP